MDTNWTVAQALRRVRKTCVLASTQAPEAKAIVERCMTDLTSGQWHVQQMHAPEGSFSVWELERPRLRLP